ncbi:hypothetical protein [Macrococcoides caseolyticum]|uniref:hypothetical protein n=1 Tax=Macrococcoides caseolyticum TaxID=69966 RepID=UPI001F1C3BD0|nr:hypothetical protein [Macrococcus caseolyticus]MCE4957421.1 hypothetical protein [Macrococcus caseolyticus]
MQNSLIKELRSLYSGEGFSGVAFFIIWLYACFSDDYQQIARQLHIAIPTITLCFILMIGTYFWRLMLRTVIKGEKMNLTSQQKRIFFILKGVSLLLLMMCSMLLILAMFSQQKYISLSIFLFGFAIIEYINYFYIRLSYLSPREFRELLRHRRLRQSHLNRLLHKKNS